MMKKYYLLVLLLFASIAGYSQQVRSWNIYGIFSGNNLQKLIDTDNSVFVLSDGWLYSYDKENEGLVYHNVMNNLSDTGVSDMYYNYDANFLFVVYDNSNIDILRDNGRVDNIPDLKNVIMTASKKINAVDFLGNYAYVATDFGYMVVDCEKEVIKESFNYGKQFNSMIATEQYIYANFDKRLYVSETNAAHYEIKSFSTTNVTGTFDLIKAGNGSFFTNGGGLYFSTIGNDPAQITRTRLDSGNAELVTKCGNGFMASYDRYYLKIGDSGVVEEKVALPEEIDGSFLSSYDGNGLWNMDKAGIKEFSISDNTFTYLHENFRPNASSAFQPYFMFYKNGILYEMNTGPNPINAEKTEYGDYPFGLSILVDGTWRDCTPDNPTFVNGNSRNTLKRTYGLAADPQDPHCLWFGTWFEGIYCVKDNKQIQKFDNSNSPFYLDYVCCVPDLDFDAEGNLWVVFHNYNNTSYSQLFVLPAEKVYDENVTANDWIDFNFGELTMAYYCTEHIVGNSNYVVFANNNWTTRLCVLDHNGTINDKSDDRQVSISSFVDQDGKSFEIGYIFCYAEDADGKIWIGTNTGVGVINNIESAFTNNFTVNRVKVARNDGTNLADYLLDGNSVTSIAIDGAGRKWFGTSSSGVYLVSKDGSEILEHFTTDNSVLPDNCITGVACSSDDNRVFIGTKKGTFVYRSDAVQSAANYDNVYAYPNPVRPDYTGYITVAGLMDNSLVKITDSAGNVVYSGKSTGGMFVWDGCAADGSPVNTGVYFVLASQADSKSGSVTKILIVR